VEESEDAQAVVAAERLFAALDANERRIDLASIHSAEAMDRSLRVSLAVSIGELQVRTRLAQHESASGRREEKD
jgi:hypothetical protein